MDPALRFLRIAMRLKTLRRAGWARCGVDPCESVADHTFGVALLALVLPRSADLHVDRDRCVALALVHDLAEAIVGDITPHDGMSAAEKSAREREAMTELCRVLEDDDLLHLWEEFEAGSSAEARLVRDLDVLDMALQAKTYRDAALLPPDQAAAFIASAMARSESPIVRRLMES